MAVEQLGVECGAGIAPAQVAGVRDLSVVARLQAARVPVSDLAHARTGSGRSSNADRDPNSKDQSGTDRLDFRSRKSQLKTLDLLRPKMIFSSDITIEN